MYIGQGFNISTGVTQADDKIISISSYSTHRSLVFPRRPMSLDSLPRVPDTDPSTCVFHALRTAIEKRVADQLHDAV